MPRRPAAPRRKMLVSIPRTMAPVRRRGLRRSVYNPTPTFTETVKLNQVASNAGGVFKFRISDIPQFASEYANLYTQYKINSIKVMLLPQFKDQDANTAIQNQSVIPPFGFQGMSRIAWAVQDSPNVGVPLSEQEVLQDNGAKIKPVGSKWSASMRPVPDVSMTTSAGVIPTRAKQAWFNFDAALIGNNPEHGSIQYWITQLVSPGSVGQQYDTYVKINFSLRDAK